MKKSFIFILLLPLSLFVYPQYSSLMIFGGINFSKQYYNPAQSSFKDKMNTGYKCGLYYTFGSKKNIGFQTGVDIEKKKYSEYGEVNYSSKFPPDPLETSSYTKYLRFVYVNIPLLFHIDYNIGKRSINSSLGLYYANKLSGNYELVRDDGTSYYKKYDNDYLDNDFGFNVLLGVEVFNNLYLDVYYKHSLIKLNRSVYSTGFFSMGVILSYHFLIHNEN